jgi:ketosteroid isomerase-like protein
MTALSPLQLAQEFLTRLGGGAEPDHIAELFREDLEWIVDGDVGALPWIGRRVGRKAVTDFVRDVRTLVEQLRFEVQDILANDTRAVVLGSLASRSHATGKVVETDFAIVLTGTEGAIARFQFLEDSFAVSQAARP